MGVCNATWMKFAQVRHYFTKGGRRNDNYYQDHAEVQVRIEGPLAERLGLKTEDFTQQLFEDAIRGVFPAGLELADKKRWNGERAVLDITFTPAKSISLEIEVRGDRQLAAIHDAATAKAMRFMSQQAQYRITKNGVTERRTANSGLAYFVFPHDTTRSHGDDKIEPNTHTHFGVLPYVLGPDGRLYALCNEKMIKAQKAASAIYDQEFCRLARKAGFKLVLTKCGPELAGYSRAFVESFSSPRAAIAKWLAARGIDIENSTNAQRRAANFATRDRKDYHDRKDLREWWQARADELGGLPPVEMVRSHEVAGLEVDEIDAMQAVESAVQHLTERVASMKSKQEILAVAIRMSDYQVEPDKVIQAIDKMFDSGALVKRNLGERIVTAQTLKEEIDIEKSYVRQTNTRTPMSDLGFAAKLIAETEAKLGGKMSISQLRMINGIVTSKDGVIVVEGDAGTGKSTGMEAIKAGAAAKGLRILGIAPSKQAVDSLAVAGIETRTSQSVGGKAGEKTKAEFWRQVDENTLIVIDEAGLLDRRATIELMAKAEAKNARLVFVGDTKQFSSVKSGAALRQLNRSAAESGREIRLDDMRRGKTDDIRDLHVAARDDAERAIKMLFEQERVTALSDPERRFYKIAEGYTALAPEERELALVLTGMNKDRVQINEAIRAKLGLELGAMARTWTPADTTAEQKKSIGSYEVGAYIVFNRATGPFKPGEMVQITKVGGHLAKVMREDGAIVDFKPRTQGVHVRGVGYRQEIELSKGDLIRFSAGRKNDDVANGDRARILEVDKEKLTAKVQLLKDQRVLEINLKQKDLALRYGYCATGHSSQGVTAKSKVWYHVTADDPTLNANSFYTNVTRSTTHIQLVTDARSSKAIAEIMRKAGQSIDPDLARLRPEDLVRRPTPAAFWPKVQEPGKCEFIKINNREDIAEVRSKLAEAREKYGRQFGVTGGEKFKVRVAEAVIGESGLREQDVRFDIDTEHVVNEFAKTRVEKLLSREKQNEHGIQGRRNRERDRGWNRRARGDSAAEQRGRSIRTADSPGYYPGRIRARDGVLEVPRSPVAYSAATGQQRASNIGAIDNRILRKNAHDHLPGHHYSDLRRPVSAVELTERATQAPVRQEPPPPPKPRPRPQPYDEIEGR